MKKLNIAILSDSCFLSTGYANQATQLANKLVEFGHEVFYLANIYMGQPLAPGATFEDGRKLNFHIIGGGREGYFKDLLPILMKQHKIDVLIILFDTFMLHPWINQIDLTPAKTVFWFPSDGGGALPIGCENVLKGMTKAVAMAKFGQQQAKKCHGLDTEYIPHAIDLTNYFRMKDDEIEEMKKQWGLKDKFVVGSVFRNQGRKMADRTLKAFSLFAQNNPDAVLLLHTDPDDNAQVFPITSLIQRYGLENKVVFTGMKYYKGWDYRDMYKVYNLMDVFLLTTSGEGFGIPTIEAQACGVPVVVTDYTTTRELVEQTGGGLMIDLVGQTYNNNPEVHGSEILDGAITGSWSVERGMCSIFDAANKLQTLKNDKELRRQLGETGMKNIRERYNWNVVGDKWKQLIEEVTK